MLKAGLTGGYATGKSLVAGELERLGCLVIYADRLGHATLEIGGEAYQPTVEAFGPHILQPDGSIDRKLLASEVFGSAERLQQLNTIVHPAVFRLERQMLDSWEAANPNSVAVIEAAILVETGRHTFFDCLIVTTCTEEKQIIRGMKRDHLTRAEVQARLERQMPAAEKAGYGDYIIDTNGTKENTLRQVNEMFEQLQRLARRTRE